MQDLDPSNNASPDPKRLLHALNEISTELQQSICSEESVYQIFQKKVIELGLRGGISELDEKANNLSFKIVAYDTPMQKILNRFERRLRTRAIGYSIPVDQVKTYKTVVEENRAMFVANTGEISAQVIPHKIKRWVTPLLSVLGRPPGIYTPLVYEGKIKGMLNMVGTDLTEKDVPAIQAFANQVAVALENARLVQKLEAANRELDTAYQKTLEGWVKALDLRDNDSGGHTLRAADLTVQLAKKMGVTESDIPHIRRGALLHDIGKMAIPDNILRKPGPLSETEWRIMKKHPQIAYAWLSLIDYLKPAAIIPYCHHERWDGYGYVQGLSGENIPFWARIFSVVDVWDAMISDRPYRHALPAIDTYQYIRQGAGKQFDPRVVEAFFELDPQKLHYSEIDNYSI
jgi:HD-GYP domain-containing protein (c-di-GMP phosphodiesterase class II)